MITIGELSNELLKYSNYVTTTLYRNVPYTVAALSDKNGYTQAYMYIVQNIEGVYAACTDITDSGGARFFPTGNITKPFIRELDMIHQMFGGEASLQERCYSSINNASYQEMIEYIYQRLIQFRIVEPNKTIVEKKVSCLGFNNPKVARVINKGFNRRGVRSGTVWDLMMLVNGLRESFSLEGLQTKDIDSIYNRLKGVGVLAEIKSEYIVDITFLKH